MAIGKDIGDMYQSTPIRGRKQPADPKHALVSFTSALNKVGTLAAAPLFGTGLTLSSLHSAQLAAQTSEFVMIDMEHSPLSPERMTQIVHAVVAASNGASFPLVRIPSSGVEWVKWALDSGAAGIIIPMVESASDMREVISQAVYPPRGKRSFGPSMAAFGLPGTGASYFHWAQYGNVAILPVIESAERVRNVAEIMAVEGVSGVFVGPVDLRLSLGLPGGLDGEEAVFTEALQDICSAGKRLGKPVGTLAIGANVIRKRIQDGMRFLVVSADTALLQEGYARSIAEARQVAYRE